VLLYQPLPDEPDITALQFEVESFLTRTPARGELTVHPFAGPMERHRFGFLQPRDSAPELDPEEIDVALVPGVVFDAQGVRLGRGSGHFDRLLARLRPDALRIGVVPAELVVDRLPMESHDLPMTHLATEEGVEAVGGAPRAPIPQKLLAETRAWIAGDPDPRTRAQLERLIALGAADELSERMAGVLEFGTAGIRGAVEAGSNRMNRATVIRTTRGLADYLIEERVESGPVIVGYDARLSSRTFAADTVAVLVAAGLSVRYFEEPVPTPLVAYAARVLAARAAIVVTASHNPARDNGYKVYDANAAQIVPPVDAEIADAIERVGAAADVARCEGALEGESERAEPIEAAWCERYIDDILGIRPQVEADRDLCIVYTPLHGVAGRLTERALAAAGYAEVHTVPQQAEPDGRFPTVAFPNPEEPGALDLALALAGDVEADLVLANDPDGDRLAVCLPGPDGWVQLTGNQIGTVLGDFLLEQYAGAAPPLVVSSIVSSPMLAAVAGARGARCEATLTGFKWIANAALDLEAAEGLEFVFGYEEALGYTVGRLVRDKDGISAATVFADLVAWDRSRGSTVIEHLERLYRQHGLWVSTQLSVLRPGERGAAEIAAAMDILAECRPAALGGFAVSEVTDFRTGAEERPRWLPESPLVVFELGARGRALVRPSGTEPKLKIYVDLCRHLSEGEELGGAEAAARDRAHKVASDLAEFLALQ
jgi:phosphomannomutase